MGNYIETLLSEEQMAAWLDDMLTDEESKMVEELLSNNTELQELQDAIDAVDITAVYDADEEVPVECLADDFTLPTIGLDDPSTTEYEEGQDDNLDIHQDDDTVQDDFTVGSDDDLCADDGTSDITF